MKYKDLTGGKFGKFIVIKQLPSRNGRRLWLCRCDCGNIREQTTDKLNRKNKCYDISCGCTMLSNRQNMYNWNGCGDISGKRWRNKERGAEKRGHVFEIDIQYAWDLFLEQNKKCAITGIDIYFPENSRKTGTASLDRIDSAKGYMEGNVQWVHKDINMMKQGYSQQYFIDVCKKIAENN